MDTVVTRTLFSFGRRASKRRAVRAVAALAVAGALPLMVNQISAAPVPAAAPPVLPVSTQFDITGFAQSATVDQACLTAGGGLGAAQAAHCGGTLQINGHAIVVPAETIAILPANALTWEELFAQAPALYLGSNPPQSGMTLADTPTPLTTYEFHAIGNRVFDANGTNGCTVVGGCDRYIAGLIHISQQDLNTGAGYINFMDYTTGEMRVGGVLGDNTTGARVQINDPANNTTADGGGRYGRPMSPDGRFMVDQDNPTIASATGFPMCFPRTDPTVNDDPLCPQRNRLDGAGVPLMKVQMNNPTGLPAGSAFDPRIQAPFEVGDYITFAGTLIDDTLPNGPASSYVSAHTIINNTAIFTWPGTNPAYVMVEVALIGTGGLTVFGVGEAANRTRFEGMTTDPSRPIHLYGIDVNPDGSTSDRDWGTIGVDPGPPTGAVTGRWRFRPPCQPFGSVPGEARQGRR